jgi:hypothetical protein
MLKPIADWSTNKFSSAESLNELLIDIVAQDSAAELASSRLLQYYLQVNGYTVSPFSFSSSCYRYNRLCYSLNGSTIYLTSLTDQRVSRLDIATSPDRVSMKYPYLTGTIRRPWIIFSSVVL